jgi:hypothetical protein
MLRTVIVNGHLECFRCILHMKSNLIIAIWKRSFYECINPIKILNYFYHGDAFSVSKIKICKKAISASTKKQESEHQIFQQDLK